MSPDVTHWVFAFVFTQLVELPIYRRITRAKLPVAFAASAITHPFVWFVLPDVYPSFIEAALPHVGSFAYSPAFHFLAYAAFLEGFAVILEAMWLRAFEAKRPLYGALVANGTSALIGWLCYRLTGWP